MILHLSSLLFYIAGSRTAFHDANMLTAKVLTVKCESTKSV